MNDRRSYEPLFTMNQSGQFYDANKILIATSRALRLGDIITLVLHAREGWCDIGIYGDNLKESIRCDIFPGEDAFYMGVQATSGEYHIIPHVKHKFRDLLQEPCKCLSSHTMKVCLSTRDSSYQSSAIVNCDACSRRAIHADSLPFQHCGVCNYDLCSACCLAKKTPADVVSLTDIGLSASCLNTQGMASAQPPLFQLGTAQWLAFDQIVSVCREFIIYNNAESDTENSNIRDWALSLMFVVALLRQSLSGVLECIQLMGKDNIRLKQETEIFLQYLTGHEIRTIQEHNKPDEPISTVIADIMSALGALSTMGYFLLSNLEEIDIIISIIKQGCIFFKEQNISLDDSETIDDNTMYSSALNILVSSFTTKLLRLSTSSPILECFKSSSLFSQLCELMNDIIGSLTISIYSPLLVKSAVTLYVILLDRICPLFNQRLGILVDYSKRLLTNSLVDTEEGFYHILSMHLNADKLQKIMSYELSLREKNEVETNLLDIVLELIQVHHDLFHQFIKGDLDDRPFTLQFRSKCLETIIIFTVNYFSIPGYYGVIALQNLLSIMQIFLPAVQCATAVLEEWRTALLSNDEKKAQICSNGNHIVYLVPLLCQVLQLVHRHSKEAPRDTKDLFTKWLDIIEVFSGAIWQLRGALRQSPSTQKGVERNISLLAKSISGQPMSWSMTLSNSHLEFRQSDRQVLRRGSVSCYPAAFAVIPSSQFAFTCVLSECSSTSNWLSIGVCKAGFATENSDGIGRTGGDVPNYGICDDRSTSSAVAQFYACGEIVYTAFRKFSLGDKITITGNLEKKWVDIEVSHEKLGKFSYRFENVALTPTNSLIGATLANDHELTIQPTQKFALPENAPKNGDDWVIDLDLVVDNLKLYLFSGRFPSDESQQHEWLQGEVFDRGVLLNNNNGTAEQGSVDGAPYSEVLSNCTAILVTLLDSFHKKTSALSLEGNDSLSSIDRTTFTAWKVLIWHSSAIPPDSGSSIPDALRLTFSKLWDIAQQVRIDLLQLEADTIQETTEDILFRAECLLQYSPLCAEMNLSVCAELVDFMRNGPKKNIYEDVIAKQSQRAEQYLEWLTLARRLFLSTSSVRAKGELLLACVDTCWRDNSGSFDLSGVRSDVKEQIAQRRLAFQKAVISFCIGVCETLQTDDFDAVYTLTISYLVCLIDANVSSVKILLDSGLLSLLESGLGCVSYHLRSFACRFVDLLIGQYTSKEGAHSLSQLLVSRLQGISRLTNSSYSKITDGTQQSNESLTLIEGSFACSLNQQPFNYPFIIVPCSHSIVFWLWLSKTQSSEGVVLTKGVVSSTKPWALIQIKYQDSRLKLLIAEGSSEKLILLWPETVTADCWVHIGYSIDVSTRKASIFLNGSEVGSGILNQALPNLSNVNSSPFAFGPVDCVLRDVKLVRNSVSNAVPFYRNIINFPTQRLFRSSSELRTVFVPFSRDTPIVRMKISSVQGGVLSVGLVHKSALKTDGSLIFGVSPYSYGLHTTDKQEASTNKLPGDGSSVRFCENSRDNMVLLDEVECDIHDCTIQMLLDLKSSSQIFRMCLMDPVPDTNNRWSFNAPLDSIDEYVVGVTLTGDVELITTEFEDGPQDIEWDIGLTSFTVPYEMSNIGQAHEADSTELLGTLNMYVAKYGENMSHVHIKSILAALYHYAYKSSSAALRLQASRCIANLYSCIGFRLLSTKPDSFPSPFFYTLSTYPEESKSAISFLCCIVDSIGCFVNPYNKPDSPSVAVTPSANTQLAQHVDIAQALLALDDKFSRGVVHEVVSNILRLSEKIIKILQKEMCSELKNKYSDRSVKTACNPVLSKLLGVLVIASGFSLGPVPGSSVNYKATVYSLPEESVVLSADANASTYADVFSLASSTNGPYTESHSVFTGLISNSTSKVNVPHSIISMFVEQGPQFINILRSLIEFSTVDTRPDLPSETPLTKVISTEYESPHPYRDNSDDYFDITIPGANNGFAIYFDPRTKTEATYDYLKFFKDSSQTDYWGEEKYSGSGNWPGVGGKPPLIINASSCYVHFHSDGSNNDWGYKFTVKVVLQMKRPPPLRDTHPALVLSRILKAFAFETLDQMTKAKKGVFEDASLFSAILPWTLQEIVTPVLRSDGPRGPYSLADVPADTGELFLILYRQLANGFYTRSVQKLEEQEKGVFKYLEESEKSSGLDVTESPFETLKREFSKVSVANTASTEGCNNIADSPSDVLPPVLMSSLSTSLHPMYSIDSSEDEVAEMRALVRNEEDYLPSLYFQLKCFNGVSHCRIRDGPSLESAEVGSVSSGLILQFSEEISGFYRLYDGRGYVKRIVKDALEWVRITEEQETPLHMMDSLFARVAEKYISRKAYEMLESILMHSPTVISQLSLATFENGEFLTLLKVCGLGKLTPDKVGLTKLMKNALRQAVSTTREEYLFGFGLVQLCLTQISLICERIKTEANRLEDVIEPETVVIESEHEYANNTDQKWHIHIPGAKSLEIVFDERSSTEKNCDTLVFYADSSGTVSLSSKYSGKSWPGFGGFPPLVLSNRNECWVGFTSDSSNTDWGFKLIATAYTPPFRDCEVGFQDDDTSLLGCTNLEILTFPSLKLVLDIYAILLECENFRPILFTSPKGLSLLSEILRSVQKIRSFHPKVIEALTDTVTNVLKYASTLGSDVASALPMLLKMAKYMVALGCSAETAKKSASGKSPSALYQALAQVTVVAALFIETNDDGTELVITHHITPYQAPGEEGRNKITGPKFIKLTKVRASTSLYVKFNRPSDVNGSMAACLFAGDALLLGWESSSILIGDEIIEFSSVMARIIPYGDGDIIGISIEKIEDDRYIAEFSRNGTVMEYELNSHGEKSTQLNFFSKNSSFSIGALLPSGSSCSFLTQDELIRAGYVFLASDSKMDDAKHVVRILAWDEDGVNAGLTLTNHATVLEYVEYSDSDDEDNDSDSYDSDEESHDDSSSSTDIFRSAFVALHSDACTLVLLVEEAPDISLSGTTVFSLGIVADGYCDDMGYFGESEGTVGVLYSEMQDGGTAENTPTCLYRDRIKAGETFTINYSRTLGILIVHRQRSEEPTVILELDSLSGESDLFFGVSFQGRFVVRILDNTSENDIPLAPPFLEPSSLTPHTKWDISISNPELVYSANNTTVFRPVGTLLSFPAALVPIKSSAALNLRVHVDEIGPVLDGFSFGVSNIFFANSGWSAFGHRNQSHGLFNLSTDEPLVFRRIKQGDILELRINRDSGTAKLVINDSEFTHDFFIPTTDAWVAGAILSEGLKLTIIQETTVDSKSIGCTSVRKTSLSKENYQGIGRPLLALAKSSDILQSSLRGSYTMNHCDKYLIPHCISSSTKTLLLPQTLGASCELNETIQIAGAKGYHVTFSVKGDHPIHVDTFSVNSFDQNGSRSVLGYDLHDIDLLPISDHTESTHQQCMQWLNIGDSVVFTGSTDLLSPGCIGDIIQIKEDEFMLVFSVRWRESKEVTNCTLGIPDGRCLCDQLQEIKLRVWRTRTVYMKGASVNIALKIWDVPEEGSLIELVVKPDLSRAAVLHSAIYKTERNSPSNRKLASNSYDAEIVQFLESVKKSRGLSKDEILHMKWATAICYVDELLRFPLLMARDAQDRESLVERFETIKELNVEIAKAFELIDMSQVRKSWTIARLVSEGRSLIFSFVKQQIIDVGMLKSQEKSGSKFELNISRRRASKYALQGQCDEFGRWSIFGQTFRKVHSMPASTLRRHEQLWDTILASERAQDLGGPYREVWTSIFGELMSPTLPLLKPSPNCINMAGEYQETWILNPDANNHTQLEMCAFLGKLIGCSARVNNCIELFLSPFVWKLIINDTVTFDDWKDVDSINYTQIEKMRKSDVGVFEQEFACDELVFATQVIGGSRVVELHTGGSQEVVTWDTRLRYCDELVAYRLKEMSEVASAIRRGLQTQLPAAVLNLVTWQEFEEMACGNPIIDVESLQNIADYSGCSPTDQTVLWLWEILNEFTSDDRKAFLKFTWGRTRLPNHKRHGSSTRFKLQVLDKQPADRYLPVSHTCFFSIEIPRYTSKEIMKEKLRYSIYNCVAIDADDNATGLRAAALEWEE